MALPSGYPIAGIFFFLAHPKLWHHTLCPFLLTLIFGLLSLVLSLVYLLPLQAHALIEARCPTWLAWTVSAVFVLMESSLMDLIFFAVLMPVFQDALFDATLRAKGLERMFQSRVPVSGLVLCCRGLSSGVVLLWFLLLAQILLFFITAPLHLIPGVGTLIACYVNGWIACWGHHIHYDLEFKGWSVRQSSAYAWQHHVAYCQFGAVAVALELVPFLNLLFLWTNVVGAALYVADTYLETESTQHPFLPIKTSLSEA
ncbi:hypothetical protein BY458DRAFT_552818 [Sporodiniella umbellata]|nr:hypothetical protein BY458DRAFT_552818 [Sporodiniella umbellata]